ncbi:hypothetical protein HYDPIDRAFT_170759 [Hydnomerulius pinastri MD-312]|uniref:Ribonuclease H1 N-terminal domain-containing protein n=1 Tax=Hydnomerulius pinastri MD-312 TaxID=994086 RepID=A0A0C9W9F8_9AGAM|nr:hypothetical protein HYDPIDRAFT_170759 [Hydnomerulius pinastri MD-312]
MPPPDASPALASSTVGSSEPMVVRHNSNASQYANAPTSPTSLAPFVIPVPHPSALLPPGEDQPVDGFWTVTVGQEVGIFYLWEDVAKRTNFIAGNRQKKYADFEMALRVYTKKYYEGSVHAVPLPNSGFWPTSPPSPPGYSSHPSPSTSKEDLWSQVEDFTL